MLLLLALACPAPTVDDSAVEPDLDPVAVRFATFNVSLFRSASGQLASDLADASLEQGQFIGNIVGDVQPDVILLNELDYDSAGTSVALLQSNFLGDAYPYVYVAPSNTGVHSGFDLDNDGTITTATGSNAYGGDAFGFGQYEGQYAFAVLSKHPLGTPRTFQTFLWRDLPDAWLPEGWFSDEELNVVRLSSKNHVDLPVTIGTATVHLLVSHPTPPAFDGPEDRNGRRNHDEIAFWSRYLDAPVDGWPVDDAGLRGGLDGASFVIAGDLNADPVDGSSSGAPMAELLGHARVQAQPAPTSEGGAEQSGLQGGVNNSHAGDPAQDTADFSDNAVGNLRLDYVLPSNDLPITANGVFWPLAAADDFEWVGTFPFPASDHRLVWVDIEVPQ